jgi:uncharacterized protein (TIGR02145 family)
MLSAGAFNLRAQVVIGSNKYPEKYSALELISNEKGGLRMPQLTTAQRDALKDGTSNSFTSNPNRAIPFLYEGLTIYNTTTRCIEYYNAQRWISMCDGTSRMTIDPEPCSEIAADGTGCDDEFTITDPDCANGPFSFVVLVGGSYAHLENPDEANGTFQIAFSANNSVHPRSAVVRVTSSCTSLYKDFLFTQLGQTCDPSLGVAPEIKGTPTIPADRSITVYMGGAVYLSVPETTPNLSELIWTRNEIEIARGVNHITVTQSGVYDVWMGLIGCNQRTNNAVKVTRINTPAPQPVTMVVAENNGVLCDANGNLKLVALTSSPIQAPAAIRWFKNGILQPSLTGDQISADVGDWFAVVNNGGAWSTPSNTVTVYVDPNANMKLTEPTFTYVGDFCAGSTIYLSVNDGDYNPSYTYTWYENNTVIATGKSCLYSVPTGAPKVVIRCRATFGNNCPAEDFQLKEIISGTIPKPPYITGNKVLCNGYATLGAMPQESGNYTYSWYKGNIALPDKTQQITINSGGDYYVTITDGCTSPMAHINIPTEGTANPVVSLVSSSATPNDVNQGDEVTYNASITFGPATNYIWTVTGASLLSGGQPGNTYAVVRFNQTGTASVKVQASNSCGVGDAVHNVTVHSLCAAPNPATVYPSTDVPVTVMLGTSSSNFTMGPVSVGFTSGSPQTAYQWYRNTTKSTAGATLLPAGTLNTLIASESVGGTYYYYCVMANKDCPTEAPVQTAYYVVTVVNIPQPGHGSFTGKSCFDIAESNSGGKCGNAASRKPKRTDFNDKTEQDPKNGPIAGTYSGVQIYTFTPPSPVSKVQFAFVDPYNAIESMSPVGDYTNSTNISIAKVKVVYSSSLNQMLIGKTSEQALRPKLYVIYNDKADGSGVLRRLELTISLQDCTCCEVATTYGGWLNFMCHNLGANENLDPFTWVSNGDKVDYDIKGAIYQWGRYTDGHERRESGTVSGPLSHGVLVGGRIPSNNSAHDKFIITSAEPFDWITNGTSFGTRWGDGTYINQPAFTGKGINDPCPDGWQLPTWLQFRSIFGTPEPGYDVPSNATVNKWDWTGRGYLIGSSLYLPAAGTRRSKDGGVEGVGVSGFYWTSSSSGPRSFPMSFTQSSVSIGASSDHRGAGMSVRCVSQ